jgi:hypothetical protein
MPRDRAGKRSAGVTRDEIAREITRTRRAIGYLDDADEGMKQVLCGLHGARRVSGLWDLWTIYTGPGGDNGRYTLSAGTMAVLGELCQAKRRLEEKIEGLIEQSRSLNRRPKEGGPTKGK